MASLPVRPGFFTGGLPYVVVGDGAPLVFLCGSTSNHRHPRPGLEQWLTLATIRPLVRAGFEVWFTNRWPGMADGTTFAEVAERHAVALADQFGGPVDVLGHSTGGSLALQLIVDHPEVVRRAVVASAAYALGPVGKRAQLEMLWALERTGRYSTRSMRTLIDGAVDSVLLRSLCTPLAALAAWRVTVDDPTDAIAMLRAEDAFDVRARLSQVTTETLVAWGGRDHYWPSEMFVETADRIPHATAACYPRLGHNLPGSGEFVTDVARFLR